MRSCGVTTRYACRPQRYDPRTHRRSANTLNVIEVTCYVARPEGHDPAFPPGDRCLSFVSSGGIMYTPWISHRFRTLALPSRYVVTTGAFILAAACGGSVSNDTP